MALYARRAAYAKSFSENRTPFEIQDNEPTVGEIQAAMMDMSNGPCGGASGIKVEHIKSWLQGAKREEDPETAGENARAGKTWRKFFGLCTSVWRKRTIGQQMRWVITFLIPKGEGSTGGSG